MFDAVSATQQKKLMRYSARYDWTKIFNKVPLTKLIGKVIDNVIDTNETVAYAGIDAFAQPDMEITQQTNR
jgi:hypothetical protein